MDLAQLEAFERVAREGSFTRAGNALNLTQPAISFGKKRGPLSVLARLCSSCAFVRIFCSTV